MKYYGCIFVLIIWHEDHVCVCVCVCVAPCFVEITVCVSVALACFFHLSCNSDLLSQMCVGLVKKKL